MRRLALCATGPSSRSGGGPQQLPRPLPGSIIHLDDSCRRSIIALLPAVMDHQEGTQLALSSDPRNRRWSQPLNLQLPATLRWAASLPVEVQPLTLLQRLPRIANAIARLWQDDMGLVRYLDELLTDRRGGRLGFAPEIQFELLQLRAYCESRLPMASSAMGHAR